MDQDNPDPAALGAAMLAVKQHEAKMKASHEAFEAKLKAPAHPRAEAEVRGLEGGPRASGPATAAPAGFRGHRADAA